MTNLDDFDRALGEFLRDGPTVAPEPPVIAALAHARAVPRRRDPFLALRPDVMARPTTLGGLRAGLVLAATALVVAAIALAVVGVGTNRTEPAPSLRSSTPPGPSVSSSIPASPVSSPATSLPPSSPGPVDLVGTAGNVVPLEIVDGSGHLLAASAVANPENVEAITLTNVASDRVRLLWPGSPCDTVYRLTIAADRSLALDRPKCFGDSIPSFYGIELRFDSAVDSASLDTALHEARFESGLPTQTVVGLDAAGNRYDLAVFDASGRLALPEPISDGSQPPDPGPTDWAAQRQDDSVGRLVWRAPACATTETLRIDAAASEWQLSWQPCEAPPTVLRVLDLTFDHLPDTTGISVVIVGPQP